ncbi:glutathione S-transferase family protein [Leptolyngbya sp. 15MV]|nr:glutathione S-transferase family protein [Leptolyngbya sp. 15MV]
MGRLIRGAWTIDNAPPAEPPTALRNWITPDGSPGPSGRGGFRAEPGRYRLYVSYACPWAHRTLIGRALKGLRDMVAVSVVHWLMRDDGWTFSPDPDGLVGDPLHGARFLRELYQRSEPAFTGRVTVPVLWDEATSRIVSTQSADILRMFNSAFDDLGATPLDLYPAPLRAEIDALNARIFETVNHGVYRAGFATDQATHETAVRALFGTLDWLEARLATSRFLLGDAPTEADWRLLPTLIRFDLVYHGHFKCNLRRIVDHPNLWAYARDLYQWPGIAATVRFDHAKRHYYESHRHINPTGIVPLGPAQDWAAAHHRAGLGRTA